MGYAFTFPLVALLSKVFRRIPIGAYVHYPTISTDMLERVQSRTAGHTNPGDVASSAWRSTAKLLSVFHSPPVETVTDQRPGTIASSHFYIPFHCFKLIKSSLILHGPKLTLTIFKMRRANTSGHRPRESLVWILYTHRATWTD